MKKSTINQIKKIIIEDELAIRAASFEDSLIGSTYREHSKEDLREEKEECKILKDNIKSCTSINELLDELQGLGHEEYSAYEMILEIMDKLLQKEILMSKLASAGLKTNR